VRQGSRKGLRLLFIFLKRGAPGITFGINVKDECEVFSMLRWQKASYGPLIESIDKGVKAVILFKLLELFVKDVVE